MRSAAVARGCMLVTEGERLGLLSGRTGKEGIEGEVGMVLAPGTLVGGDAAMV